MMELTLMRKLLPVGCIRYSLRMGFKTLSFFCPVLGGPPGEAGSAPLRRTDRRGVSCRRRSGSSVSPVGYLDRPGLNVNLGLRSVGTPRISIGPASYRINRD